MPKPSIAVVAQHPPDGPSFVVMINDQWLGTAADDALSNLAFNLSQ